MHASRWLQLTARHDGASGVLGALAGAFLGGILGDALGAFVGVAVGVGVGCSISSAAAARIRGIDGLVPKAGGHGLRWIQPVGVTFSRKPRGSRERGPISEHESVASPGRDGVCDGSCNPTR